MNEVVGSDKSFTTREVNVRNVHSTLPYVGISQVSQEKNVLYTNVNLVYPCIHILQWIHHSLKRAGLGALQLICTKSTYPPGMFRGTGCCGNILFPGHNHLLNTFNSGYQVVMT